MIELAFDSFGTPSPAQSRVLFDQISVGHSRYIVADRPVLLAGISPAVFLLGQQRSHSTPTDEDAPYNMGNTLMALGQAGEALAHYNTALQINPDDTQALNNLASMLATCPDALIRHGAKAVALAERAIELARHQGNSTLADSIRGQVEVYHASSPFRDHRSSSIR